MTSRGHRHLRTLLAPLVALIAILALAGCDRTGNLNATLWTQTAAEHEALCLQVFATATQAVEKRVATPGDKPFAVIVDVDETVLDNSPYQARLVLDQEDYSAASWAGWCREARAAAIPGAVAFAQRCQQRGVRVFYVTNRTIEVEAATRTNLAAVGFPLADTQTIDVVLSRGDIDVKSSKVARRARVAADHEVIAMLGDDLHDFVDAEGSVEARRRVVSEHAERWGTQWFVLPNPMYGSWERTLTAGTKDAFVAKTMALRPER